MVLRVVSNPPNPFHSEDLDWEGAPPNATLSVFEDASRSILSKNDSPDIGFEYSVNPYRGCYHGCAYCYARPSHQYLDFGAGTDFEKKIVLKKNAPELLRAAFEKKSWRGDLIVFSGNTDCYQPLEASYRLTRRCLEVCAEYRNPVGIITKGSLIERDIDVLQEINERSFLMVHVSVPFIDAKHARAIEPFVPKPTRRIETIAKLSQAGIDVGVMVAPIIPGLNDADAPQVLEAARAAGAKHYGTTLVRLPAPLDAVFEERIRAELPLRAERILSQIRECRGGGLSTPGFGDRMRGTGGRWESIRSLVTQTAERLGFEPYPSVPSPSPFQRPRQPLQYSLF